MIVTSDSRTDYSPDRGYNVPHLGQLGTAPMYCLLATATSWTLQIGGL
jgi:hypothetical protein